MGVDLDVWPELVPDRAFELAREPVGGAEAHAPVDLEVEAHAEPARDILDDDVVDGHPPLRGDEQDALQ